MAGKQQCRPPRLRMAHKHTQQRNDITWRTPRGSPNRHALCARLPHPRPNCPPCHKHPPPRPDPAVRLQAPLTRPAPPPSAVYAHPAAVGNRAALGGRKGALARLHSPTCALAPSRSIMDNEPARAHMRTHHTFAATGPAAPIAPSLLPQRSARRQARREPRHCARQQSHPQVTPSPSWAADPPPSSIRRSGGCEGESRGLERVRKDQLRAPS